MGKISDYDLGNVRNSGVIAGIHGIPGDIDKINLSNFLSAVKPLNSDHEFSEPRHQFEEFRRFDCIVECFGLTSPRLNEGSRS